MSPNGIGIVVATEIFFYGLSDNMALFWLRNISHKMQRCFILLCAFVKLISILVFRVMCHQTMSVSRTFLDIKTSNRNWSYYIIPFIPKNISNLTIIFEYNWWCGSTHRKYHLWSSTCILSTHASRIYNNMIFHEKLFCK